MRRYAKDFLTVIDIGQLLIELVYMGYLYLYGKDTFFWWQIPAKFCFTFATDDKTSYKTTCCAYTYNSQVDQKAKMKLQRNINPSGHLSDSCISKNLTDNPSKCCSQLPPIGGTLPVVTNSHLPHPQRVCVCVCACVSNLMFNATSPPFTLITVSVMNF